MILELIRTYYPRGTNGEIRFNNEQLCYTIELPWKNNEHNISCIPEGNYPLQKRCSEHFGWHLQVMNVPDRVLILIHPANDALKELKGCIAPVTILTGEGKGDSSVGMLTKLKMMIYPVLNKGEEVILSIKKNNLTESSFTQGSKEYEVHKVEKEVPL